MNESDETYLTKSKLRPFFSQSCCPGGFNANKKDNFYDIYNKLFKQLDAEEELEEQVGVKHHVAKPFGDDFSTAEIVFDFYDDW